MKFPPAIVLVGGLGTRLRPVVSDRPKPLALINGKPFLHYLLTALAAQGVRDVVLCVGYKGAAIPRVFGNGKRYGLHIRYTFEKKLLGTGGALRKGLSMVSGPYAFVLNGDSFVDVPLKTLFAVHRKKKAMLTMTVIPHVGERHRYGGIVRDRNGFLMAYAEKRSGHSFMNAGIYCISRHILAAFPRKNVWSLEHDFFPSVSEKKIFTYLHRPAFFLDIGTPKDYAKSHALFRRLFPDGS